MNNKCICCGSDLDNYPIKDYFLKNHLQICINCKHIQFKEIPSLEIISDYYNNAYSVARAKHVGRYYYKLMKKRAISQLKYIFKHVNRTEVKNGIDIGAGYGFLVKEMINEGLIAKGTEYDDISIKYAKENLGFELIKINSEIDYLASSESFDLITLSHVFEHLLNIQEFIELAKTKAKYIFIEVPNYNYKEEKQYVDQGGHINFFNTISLKLFFEKNNLEVINIGTYGPELDSFSKSPRIFKIIKTLIHNDYFYNDYDLEKNEGLWIRSLVKVK